MNIDDLVRLRPFVYHMTARSNLARVERVKRLECANVFYKATGRLHESRERRREHALVVVDGERVSLRDQAPLHVGNIDLSLLTFAEVVNMLNQYVYFWPGDDEQPIASGRNHFARYSKEDAVVLRLPTDQLLSLNAVRAKFSRCNSGAPRQNAGRKQPRGLNTFRNAACFDETPGNVQEIVIEGWAELPWSSVVVKPLSVYTSS